jgi:hypothetical protein
MGVRLGWRRGGSRWVGEKGDETRWDDGPRGGCVKGMGREEKEEDDWQVKGTV